jgi:ribosomal protein S18 acetylase RimI-like enzyme
MIRIVKADISHTELLVTIGKTTFLDAHGHSAPKKDIDTYTTKTYTFDAVTKELSQPKNIYHILYYNNVVAGYSKIVMNSSNENVIAANITKLDRIYFLKEFYGFGLSKKLFDFNIELSKKQHQKGIWLAVWIDNLRAINFYTKTGFSIVGEYDFKISKTHTNPNHIMYLDH